MARTLTVAVQMDPMESIGIDGDSTFALMLEAQARGHKLWHYEVRHMSLREGVPTPGAARNAHGGDRRPQRLFARARPVTVQRVAGAHFSFGPMELIDLGTMDAVLMRQDPPFDMGYITATHLLEHIHPRTLVVNDPASVRNAPEKLLVTHFPELMPPTLITWDIEAIRGFRAEHQDIIVKPLFGNGGAGVFRIKPDDENLSSLLEMHFARSREPLMFQRYEPAVRRGDKRIILIDGVAMGAINRVPAMGEARSNMHVGGRPEKTLLTPREQEICATIGPTLRDQGLIFVGIDVIGDWLTEINVTSPTGLQEVARFDGTFLEQAIWDSIEAKIAAAQP
jgi:glutathione synthase